MSETTDVSAMVLLIKRSIAFADWAAGEGICPAGYDDPEAEAKNPDEFLFAYSKATGDERWTTLADRITGAFEAERNSHASLAEENRRLREALEPFARYIEGGMDLSNTGDPLPDDQALGWIYLTYADFRRARAALQPVAGKEG